MRKKHRKNHPNFKKIHTFNKKSVADGWTSLVELNDLING